MFLILWRLQRRINSNDVVSLYRNKPPKFVRFSVEMIDYDLIRYETIKHVMR